MSEIDNDALPAHLQQRKPPKRAAKAKPTAVAKKLKAPADPWDALLRLIGRYSEAAISDSWKGGGDPADVETIKLRLKLARMELIGHIEKMKRELT